MSDESKAEPKEKEPQPAEEAVVEEVKKAELPNLHAGQTVRLHLRISEGKKDRTQIYQGIIIKKSGKNPAERTITVRKENKGYGVEKIIPLAMPTLEKVEVVRKAKVRRSKLYFLRNYRKRLKERQVVENS